MPFVNMPTAVLNMPAPDWGRFAAQANEFIQRGAEMRQRSGEKFLESIDKATAQASKIMQYNSPEEKMKRKMEMMKSQFMMETYNDYKLHPEKYKMTANGPVLLDVLEQASKLSNYRRSLQQEGINAINLGDKTNKGNLNQGLNNLVDLSVQLKSSGKVPANKTPSTDKVITPDSSTNQQNTDSVPNDAGVSGEKTDQGTSDSSSSNENQPPPGGGGAYYGNIEDYWT